MAKKFTEFNKGNLDEARALIQGKLDELADLGLVIKMGNISYGSDFFNSKITVSVVGAEDEYAREYDSRVRIGYDKADLVGLEFSKGAKLYKFRGAQPRARKSPYLAEDMSNGKLYKFDREEIMKLIKSSNPQAEV